LDIKESLVYDSFNKIRFKNIKTSLNLPLSSGEIDQNSSLIKGGQRGVSSTDLVISYCLFDEKNIDFVKEKILFPNSL
jgi:hypothetical protein